jgi:hypothetical protein
LSRGKGWGPPNNAVLRMISRQPLNGSTAHCGRRPRPCTALGRAPPAARPRPAAGWAGGGCWARHGRLRKIMREFLGVVEDHAPWGPPKSVAPGGGRRGDGRLSHGHTPPARPLASNVDVAARAAPQLDSRAWLARASGFGAFKTRPALSLLARARAAASRSANCEGATPPRVPLRPAAAGARTCRFN